MKIIPEAVIQQQAVKWFNNNYCLPMHEPQLIIHSVPNGINVPCKLSDRIKGLDLLNKTGQKSGVADLLIHGKNGKCIWAECKRPGEKQSPEQEQLENQINKLGGVYFVFRSLEEFQTEINKHISWLKN